MRYTFKMPDGTRVEASSLDAWWNCERDFAYDIQTVDVICDDRIRKAYNSAKIEHQLAEQQRPLDPFTPRDKFEARHIEEATGRVYIGEDRSGLSEKAQRALEKGDRKEYDYQQR